MDTSKILIVGIGGVGGYFGGLLARQYRDRGDVEVYFLSRGANLRQIQAEGLKVVDDQREFVAHPERASDDARDFGTVDYVLLCTKTYHLPETIPQILPCLHGQTVVIPLQNGVDNRAAISPSLPAQLVTDGCVYLISRLDRPGSIVKKGQVGSLFFGLDQFNDPRLDHLQALLLGAAIQSELRPDISKVIWEKFIFLSSIATATTYFDALIHPILDQPERRVMLTQLIQEVTGLAVEKGISIGAHQSERVVGILSGLPPEATSSMHTDFQLGKEKTELESLTGYVVREGKRMGVGVATFELMYNHIQEGLSKPTP